MTTARIIIIVFILLKLIFNCILQVADTPLSLCKVNIYGSKGKTLLKLRFINRNYRVLMSVCLSVCLSLYTITQKIML